MTATETTVITDTTEELVIGGPTLLDYANTAARIVIAVALFVLAIRL